MVHQAQTVTATGFTPPKTRKQKQNVIMYLIVDLQEHSPSEGVQFLVARSFQHGHHHNIGGTTYCKNIQSQTSTP
jgi:hypothetical protein